MAKKGARTSALSSAGVVALANANEIITGIQRLMAADKSDQSIVAYVAELRRKASLLDQYSLQIEALRRQVETKTKPKERL